MSQKRLRTVGALFFSALAVAWWDQAATGQLAPYELVRLSGLPGASYHEAGAISNSGVVVGTSHFSDLGIGGPVTRAFVIKGGVTSELLLPGAQSGDESPQASSVAFDVNDFDEVVGASDNAAGREVAFLARNGQMVDLNTMLPPGTTWELMSARAINRAGVVTGLAASAAGTRAYRLDTRTRAFEVLPMPTGGIGSMGWAVNDTGAVVGSYEVPAGSSSQPRAFLASPGQAPVDLGVAPGHVSAIASRFSVSSPSIAGNSYRVSPVSCYGYVPSAVRFPFPGVVPSGLGYVSNTHIYSELLDINAAGVAVGVSGNCSESVPVLWRPGQGPVEVKALPGVPASLSIYRVSAINDAEDLVGSGAGGLFRLTRSPGYALTARDASTTYGEGTTLSVRLTGTPGVSLEGVVVFDVDGDGTFEAQATLKTDGEALLAVPRETVRALGAGSRTYRARYTTAGGSLVEGSGTLAVGKAAPAFSFPDQQWPYDGTAKTPTATAAGPYGESLGPLTFGFTPGSGAPLAVGTYTATARFAGDANHLAGEATATLRILDVTPPVIVPQVVGVRHDTGWYTSDVRVTWNATDAESPTTVVTGCGESTVATNTAGLTLSCTASSAGGTATQTLTVRRDATPPAITSSLDGATLEQGRVVPADYRCTDVLNEPSTCAGSVVAGAPLDTSRLGDLAFSVTATDAVGNQVERVISAFVAPPTNSFLWLPQTGGTRPTPRYGHGMVYDPERKKTILIGGLGQDGTYLNDVWERDSVTGAWELITPATADAPVGRHSFGVAFDQDLKRVIVYAGRAAQPYYGDTWEWKPATRTWRHLLNGDPATGGLGEPAMTWDPVRRQVLLFGGVYYWGEMNRNTYALGSSGWQVVANTGPEGRRYASMTADTRRSRVVLFGGRAITGAPLNDTWEWDGVRWLQRAALGGMAPSGLAHPAMAFDARRAVTVLFGGGPGGAATIDETWEWNGGAWARRQATGSPSARITSMVYDSTADALVLFGGGSDSVWKGDEWLGKAFEASPYALAALDATTTYGLGGILSARISAPAGLSLAREVRFDTDGDGVFERVATAGEDGTALVSLSASEVRALGAGTHPFAARHADASGFAVSASGQVQVQKAAPVFTFADQQWPYDGTVKTPVASAAGPFGEALAPLTLEYAPGPGAPAAVGTYTATVRFAGDPNHLAGTATATLRILDVTPPVITPVVTGARHASGWYTSDVTIAWTVVDPESPITSSPCGTPAMYWDSPGQTFGCSATSQGGTAQQSVTIKRDATAPRVDAPAHFASVQRGTPLMAAWTCVDVFNGVAACEGQAPQGTVLDTSRVGVFGFQITAEDSLGNRRTRELRYSVTPPSTFTAREVNAPGFTDISIVHVSDTGRLVGAARFADDGEYHVVAWENGILRDLVGRRSWVASQQTSRGVFEPTVNRRGDVLGQMTSSGAQTAFLHRDGQLIDLTVSGVPTQPAGLNDSGQVLLRWPGGNVWFLYTPAAPPAQFTRLSFGGLPDVYMLELTDAGLAVGTASGGGVNRAFVYDATADSYRELVVEGSSDVVAVDVAPNGTVALRALVSGQYRPYIGTPDGAVRPIPAGDGSVGSIVVNDDGVVWFQQGDALFASDGTHTWRGWGASQVSLSGVTDGGTAVGRFLASTYTFTETYTYRCGFSTCTGTRLATGYRYRGFAAHEEGAVDLRWGGANVDGYLQNVNSSGAVLANGGGAVLFQPALGPSGRLTALQSDSGAVLYPVALNELGDALTSSSQGAAFLYRNGSSIDLSQAVRGTSGLTLTSGMGIGDRGHVVARGTRNGATGVWLLTPEAQSAITVAAAASVYGVGMPVQASVTADGAPVAGATVTFQAGTQTTVAVTDASGSAVAVMQLPSGQHVVTATYAGTPGVLPSQATTTATVAKATAIIRFGGTNKVVYDGTPQVFTAQAIGGRGEDLGALQVLYRGSYAEKGTEAPTATDVPPVDAGEYRVEASYPGDANHLPVTGISTLAIFRAQATVTVVSATHVYDGLPHPTMAFATGVGETDLGELVVTYDPGPLAPVDAGRYTASARFEQSRNYEAATGEAIVEITRARAAASVVGGTFVYDGRPHPAVGRVLGIQGEALAAVLTYSSADAPVNAGTYQATVTFAGSNNYEPASASAAITIEKATPVITVSGGTFGFDGRPHGATATVTGVLNEQLGDVTWSYSPGPRTPVDAGTYVATASYPGSANYLPVQDSATITIAPGAPNVVVSGGTFVYDGQPHPAAGAVTGLDGQSLGTLSFTYNGSPSLPIHAGTYAVTASFGGAGNYAAATATTTVQITPAALTATVVSASKVYGQPNPTFALQFAGFVPGDGPGVLAGTPVYQTLADATSPVGTYAVSAAGLSSPDYLVTMVAGQLSVVPAASSVVAGSSTFGEPAGYQQSIELHARVAPQPAGAGVATGTVEFVLADGALLGQSSLVAGTATINVILPSGTHVITARYAGDLNVLPATGQFTQVVSDKQGSTTTELNSPASSSLGDAVLLEARVSGSGTPTGSVQLLDGGTVLGEAALVSGRANFQVTGLAAGAHTLTARYLGFGAWPASTSAPVVHNVFDGTVKERTSVKIGVPSKLGASFTITATVSGGKTVPTGTATFYLDGQRLVQPPQGVSLDAAGQAVLEGVPTPLPGSHLITVLYGGSSTHAGAVAEIEMRVK